MLSYPTKFIYFILIPIYCILLILVVVRRPYLNSIHNIRSGANLAITIAILAVYAFYKLQEESSKNLSKICLYLPILVCALLLACAVYSLVAIIYQIYTNCKSGKFKGNCHSNNELNINGGETDMNMYMSGVR